MSILFFAVSFLGSIYFGFFKRRFDLFSLAFFSACIYFSPGFFGYTLYPNILYNEKITQVPLIPETYLVMIVVLFSILFSGIVFDSFGFKKRTAIIVDTSWSLYFILLLVGFGLFASLVTSTSSLFSPDKNVVLSGLNRWYTIWTFSASLGAVLSFAYKKWKLLFFFFILLLFDVFVGFRSIFAITMLSIILIWLSQKGESALIRDNIKLISYIILFAFFIFSYKYLYIFIKFGYWDLLLTRLSDPDFFVSLITHSEPFVTQAILNSVIENDFYIGMDHFAGLLNQFSIMPASFGLELYSFNSIFQPALFPNHISGMANNIWAEMWSGGGWLLLIVFIFIFNSFLFLGSYALLTKDPSIISVVALMGSYWAFYIHRNDLGFQLTLEKRILLIWLMCTLASVILRETSRWYLFKTIGQKQK